LFGHRGFGIRQLPGIQLILNLHVILANPSCSPGRLGVLGVSGQGPSNLGGFL
jgi:hypothetical protein